MSDLNKNYYEKITFRDALRLAIHDSMQEDEKIIVMGEDVAAYGGAYGATKDLLKLFNDSRLLQHQLNRFNEYLVNVKTQQGYAEASTQSGLKIVFDQKDFREQLKRLEDFISFELLSGSLHNIRTIDMRYKNGVAIAFGNKEKV